MKIQSYNKLSKNVHIITTHVLLRTNKTSKQLEILYSIAYKKAFQTIAVTCRNINQIENSPKKHSEVP